MSSSRFVKISTYRVGHTIGAGSFGSVRYALSEDGAPCAIKVIDKKEVLRGGIAEVERASREFFILTSLDHKNVIRLSEVFQDDNNLYLVMEYADGGTLESRLAGLPDHRFTEDEARDIFRQIANAVRYCHRKQVAHRDLKTENVLLSAGSTVKVADFGLSNTMTHASQSPVGTPLYSAPEILFPAMYPFLLGASSSASSGSATSARASVPSTGGARAGVASATSLPKGALTDVRPPQHTEYTGLMADIWSLGVVLFRMVTGRLPFPAESMRQLKGQLFDTATPNGEGLTLPFPTGPERLSPSLEALITGCLCLNPYQRLTADEALQHRWLSADASGSLTSFLLGGGGEASDDEVEGTGAASATSGAASGRRPLLAVSTPAGDAGGASSLFDSARGSASGRRLSTGGDSSVVFRGAASPGISAVEEDDEEDGPISLVVAPTASASGASSGRGSGRLTGPGSDAVPARPGSSSTTLRRPVSSASASGSSSTYETSAARRVSMTAAPVSRLSAPSPADGEGSSSTAAPPSYRFSSGSRYPVASFAAAGSRPGSGRVSAPSCSEGEADAGTGRSPVKSGLSAASSPVLLGRPGSTGIRLSLTTASTAGGGAGGSASAPGSPGVPAVTDSPPGSTRPPISPALGGRGSVSSGTSELLAVASVTAARRRTDTGGAASPLSLAAAAAVAAGAGSPVGTSGSPRFGAAAAGSPASRPSSGTGFVVGSRAPVPSRLSLQPTPQSASATASTPASRR